MTAHFSSETGQKIGDASARGGRLHRELSSFGVLLLTLSCLSPVLSIYGVGSDVFRHAGTGAAPLFLLGIGAAAIFVLVYAELGSAYPYAGGDYVAVGSILGPGAGFASLAIWAVTAGPTAAFEAKIIATYVGEFTPMISAPTITYGALAVAIGIALLAVRTSAIVTGLFLGIEALTVAALTYAGLSHPFRSLAFVVSDPQALSAAGTIEPVTWGTMALAGATTAFATCGGNQAIAFGEELGQAHSRMGRVIVLAGLIGG